jgi:CheY-like chemotaxis protein
MGETIRSDGGPEGGRLAGHRVLVVDDDEDIRTFLLAVLADAGAILSEAADGETAVAKALEEKPDIITLDLSMPGGGGIEAFCQLRKLDATREIPVCIVTGYPEYRKLIYDRPVPPPEGFLTKPIEAAYLVRTLQRILGLRDRRAVRSARKRQEQLSR